jgi:hypothetical protein
MWAHEFTQNGTYAFKDSKKASQMTIISVKAATENCPDTANIKPMSQINLSQVGVTPPNKNVVPNYTFMVGTFLLLIIFNFFIAFGIVWLNQSNHASDNESL